MRRTRIFFSALVLLSAMLIPLTAYAVDPNAELFEAARRGDAATVRALIDKGADVNAKDHEGWTALQMAKEGGLTEIVKLLKKAGAKETPTKSQPSIHRVKSGDTLQRIAGVRYGSPHYSKVIALYNHIDNPARLAVGTELNVPDLSVVLEAAGLTRLMGDEVQNILAAKRGFSSVEGRIKDIRQAALESSQAKRGRLARLDLPEDVSSTLSAASENIARAADGFGLEKEGVVKPPRRLIGQLRSASKNLKELASGAYDGYGYDLDMVHQRIANALAYGIIWARNGFE